MTTKLLRTLMGMVALVAMLTACSSEDVLLDEPNAKNEITFNVTNERASRALTNITSATGIEQFHLYAWTRPSNEVSSFAPTSPNNNQYIMGDLMIKKDGKWVADDNDVRYWPMDPADQVLDFYAYVYGNGKESMFKGEDESGEEIQYQAEPYLSWTEKYNNVTRPAIKAIDQAKDASLQVDMLFSTAIDQVGYTPAAEGTSTTKASSKTVDLKFIHAFSQVAIEAQCANHNLHIEIAEVGLMNLYQTADFFFPYQNNLSAQPLPAVYNIDSSTERTIDVTAITKDGENDCIILNSSETPTLLTKSDNVFMVIPWDYTTIDNAAMQNNNFNLNQTQCIRIKCKIWNVADGNEWHNTKWYDGKYDKDLLIYGEKDTVNGEIVYGYKDLYIPIVFDWKMNTKYKYSLIFGKGNAGLDKDGNPSLVKVEYKATYNDWEPETVDNKPTEPVDSKNGE